MSTATDMRDFYLAAEAKVLKGQIVQFGDRRLGMADLAEIRKGRAEWEQRAAAEAASSAGANAGFSLANFSGCR